MKRPRSRPRAVLLDVPRLPQPDDVTCGPACLAQVYRFHGLDKPIEDVVRETPRNPDGGTLIPYLATSALGAGFAVTVHAFGLRVFDPTWRKLSPEALAGKLRARRDEVASRKVKRSTEAYLDVLERGGKLSLGPLSKDLLLRHLARSRPIVTGLSATYLYQTPRELDDVADDVRGFPVGHFVVVSGYDPKSDRFALRDPSKDIPFSVTGRYSVPSERLITAILLGDTTFDAGLLVVEPRRRRRA